MSFRLFVVLLVVGLFIFGCTSTTRITTQEGAKIYNQSNDELLGVGQATYSDSKPVGMTSTFYVEKDGCQTEVLTIRRSQVRWGRIVGGFFSFGLAWVWAGDYRDSYGVRLRCGDEAVPDAHIDE